MPSIDAGTLRRENHVVFVLGCAVGYFVLTFLLPSYSALKDPDSEVYLQYHPTRTAFYPLFLRLFTNSGLSLEQITYVQLGLFAAALAALLGAMLRVGIPRWLIVLFVVALAANTYFSSFHKIILTESIFSTLTVIALAFWLDYLRSGRVLFLAIIGLCIGFMIGVRPAGVSLLPMLFLTAWLKWSKRNTSAIVFLIALVGPVTVGLVVESLAYRAEHNKERQSTFPLLLAGKAAMLVRDDTVFTGPHADTLNALGKKVLETYKPVHEFIAGIPSFPARVVLTANYEAMSQFQVVSQDAEDASRKTGVPADELRSELGKQAIMQNIPGYLRLTFTHYVGQWMVNALKFPPTSKALNQYVDSYPKIPLAEMTSDALWRPKPTMSSIVVFPAFAIAGVATFVMSFALIPFLLYPDRKYSPRVFYLMLAAFFSVMCHVHTIIVSMMNVSTPRFLMAVYPQIGLAIIFLLMSLLSHDREMHGVE